MIERISTRLAGMCESSHNLSPAARPRASLPSPAGAAGPPDRPACLEGLEERLLLASVFFMHQSVGEGLLDHALRAAFAADGHTLEEFSLYASPANSSVPTDIARLFADENGDGQFGDLIDSTPALAGARTADVILFKSCFTAIDNLTDDSILAEWENAFVQDVAGYAAGHPAQKIVAMPAAPQKSDMGTVQQSARARSWATWLKTAFLSAQNFPNSNGYSFDLFDALATPVGQAGANFLRPAYAQPGYQESHPNDAGYTAAANALYAYLDAFVLPAGPVLPTLSIADAALAEGDAGTTDLTFTVTLSSALADDVTVQYATADQTATAGSDYTAATDTVTVPANQTTATFTVSLLGDVDPEPDETFTVTLSNPSAGAALGDSQAIGTILNDDLPTLSIADAAILEGNAGSKFLSFIATLSQAACQDVTFTYATADGTALAGSDYTAAGGTSTIPAEQTSRTVRVPVRGDLTYEADETFTVTLSNPTGATLAVATATGTIRNDDARPDLTFYPAAASVLPALVGAALNLNAIAWNRAAGGTEAFSVGLYCSTDPTVTTADTLLAGLDLAALRPWGISRLAFAATAPAVPGTYYLAAIADSGEQIEETSETNNTGTVRMLRVLPAGQMHLGGGLARTARFTDADGSTVIVTLGGPGEADLVFTGTVTGATFLGGLSIVNGTNLRLTSLACAGTSAAASILAVWAAGGTTPGTLIDTIQVGQVGTTEGLLLLSAGSLHFNANGVFQSAGRIGRVTLGDLGSQTVLTLGGTAQSNPVSVAVGAANAARLISPAPIATLTAAAWPVDGLVRAPWLGSLRVSGRGPGLPADFYADLDLQGADGQGYSLRSAYIGHDISATWQIAGKVQSIFVGGSLTSFTLELPRPASAGDTRQSDLNLGSLYVARTMFDALIVSAGHVGSVTAGAMNSAWLYVGIQDAAAPFGSLALAAGPAAVIKSVTTRGLYNPLTRRFDPGFADSFIAASGINMAVLRYAQGDNSAHGNRQFGLACTNLGYGYRTNMTGRLFLLPRPPAGQVLDGDMVLLAL